jgi:uncharacterized membrane protein
MSEKKIGVLTLVALLIGGFILFILTVSFIVGNEFSVERSVVIDKPKNEVFDYIRYLENQYSYSVWG